MGRTCAEKHPEGDVVFQHACKMGLDGIVSKRLGSHYRSGRSPDWLKFKNPSAPAVKREAEEDWAGNGFFRLRGFGCPRKFQTGNFRAFLLDPLM